MTTRRAIDLQAKKWLGSLNNNLGWSSFEQGEYSTALDYFYQALAARETQGDDSAIRIARWCVAKALRMLGQINEALTIQEARLAINQQFGAPDGYVYEELGECYLALQQPIQAFAQAYTLLAQDSWLVDNEGERLTRLKTLGCISL